MPADADWLLLRGEGTYGLVIRLGSTPKVCLRYQNWIRVNADNVNENIALKLYSSYVDSEDEWDFAASYSVLCC